MVKSRNSKILILLLKVLISELILILNWNGNLTVYAICRVFSDLFLSSNFQVRDEEVSDVKWSRLEFETLETFNFKIVDKKF